MLKVQDLDGRLATMCDLLGLHGLSVAAKPTDGHPDISRLRVHAVRRYGGVSGRLGGAR